MSKSFIPYRIIFDSDGIIEVSDKLGKTEFANFVYNLMYINTNTEHNKKNQIITSKKSFEIFTKKLSNKIDDTTINILEPAIRPHSFPEDIETIDNEVKRIWEHTSYVSAKEPPFQAIIFTSSSKVSEYEALKKQDKKDNIAINSGDDAISIIKTYHAICRENKEGS